MHLRLTFALVLLAAFAAGGTASALADGARDSRWFPPGQQERSAGHRLDGFAGTAGRQADSRRHRDSELPLSQILRRIQRSEGGKAEQIRYSNGRYVILWRYPDGRLSRLVADAETGRISRER